VAASDDKRVNAEGEGFVDFVGEAEDEIAEVGTVAASKPGCVSPRTGILRRTGPGAYSGPMKSLRGSDWNLLRVSRVDTVCLHPCPGFAIRARSAANGVARMARPGHG
jgi:hypothetical protein